VRPCGSLSYELGHLASLTDVLTEFHILLIVERALLAFAERARFARRPEMMAAFPEAGAFGPGDAPWRKSAIRFYRNWLDIVAERKAALLEEAPIAVARLGG